MKRYIWIIALYSLLVFPVAASDLVFTAYSNDPMESYSSAQREMDSLIFSSYYEKLEQLSSSLPKDGSAYPVLSHISADPAGILQDATFALRTRPMEAWEDSRYEAVITVPEKNISKYVAEYRRHIDSVNALEKRSQTTGNEIQMLENLYKAYAYEAVIGAFGRLDLIESIEIDFDESQILSRYVSKEADSSIFYDYDSAQQDWASIFSPVPEKNGSVLQEEEHGEVPILTSEIEEKLPAAASSLQIEQENLVESNALQHEEEKEKEFSEDVSAAVAASSSLLEEAGSEVESPASSMSSGTDAGKNQKTDEDSVSSSVLQELSFGGQKSPEEREMDKQRLMALWGHGLASDSSDASAHEPVQTVSSASESNKTSSSQASTKTVSSAVESDKTSASSSTKTSSSSSTKTSASSSAKTSGKTSDSEKKSSSPLTVSLTGRVGVDYGLTSFKETEQSKRVTFYELNAQLYFKFNSVIAGVQPFGRSYKGDGVGMTLGQIGILPIFGYQWNDFSFLFKAGLTNSWKFTGEATVIYSFTVGRNDKGLGGKELGYVSASIGYSPSYILYLKIGGGINIVELFF